MSEKPKKTPKASLLREVAPKKKHGLSVPRIKYPHEDYLKLVEELPSESITNQESNLPDSGITDTTGITGTTGYTGTTNTHGTTGTTISESGNIINKKISLQNQAIQEPVPADKTRIIKNPEKSITELHPTSPVNNFTKTPNSVTKVIQAQGLFRGKSKQIYDFLWSVSRGSINPKRMVRKTHGEIKAGAGLGSRNTVLDGLKHLSNIGLIKIISSVGVNDGNEYEIFTPEETGITGTSGISGYTTTTGLTGISQNLAIPVQPDSGTTGITQPIDNTVASTNAKTFLKTKEERIDDEPAAAFRSHNEKLNQGFRELTGREATVSDEQKLAQLGELITAELLEAASRTKVVSDPAAFLLTHMRRRLGVRTIKLETTGEKETGKGTASSTKPTRREIQLSDDEIQECPDCQGRLLIYPQGQGKGAVMCKHLPLIKAKQSEEPKQPKAEKEEGK